MLDTLQFLRHFSIISIRVVKDRDSLPRFMSPAEWEWKCPRWWWRRITVWRTRLSLEASRWYDSFFLLFFFLLLLLLLVFRTLVGTIIAAMGRPFSHCCWRTVIPAMTMLMMTRPFQLWFTGKRKIRLRTWNLRNVSSFHFEELCCYTEPIPEGLFSDQCYEQFCTPWSTARGTWHACWFQWLRNVSNTLFLILPNCVSRTEKQAVGTPMCDCTASSVRSPSLPLHPSTIIMKTVRIKAKYMMRHTSHHNVDVTVVTLCPLKERVDHLALFPYTCPCGFSITQVDPQGSLKTHCFQLEHGEKCHIFDSWWLRL